MPSDADTKGHRPSPSVELAERMTWPLVETYLRAGRSATGFSSGDPAGVTVCVSIPLVFFYRGSVTDDDTERMRKAVERTWRREVRKLWERTQLAPLAAKDAATRARLLPDSEVSDAE